ncbi:MAG: hypothetical protein AB7U38_15110 [Hyphomicrobiales bacterium]
MTLVWPIGILTPQTIGRPYMTRSTAGTTAISGEEQVVVSPAARWMIRYLNITANRRGKIIAHDALEVILEGRANPILVPLCEGSRRPFATGFPFPSVPHSDNTPFSDSTEYETPAIAVVANVAAAQGATTMGMTVVDGGDLEPGQHFTIGERLYRIRLITSQDGADYVVTFRPRLREAVADGARIDFERLWCKCRLLNDDGLDMDLDMLKRGTFSPIFVEYMGT